MGLPSCILTGEERHPASYPAAGLKGRRPVVAIARSVTPRRMARDVSGAGRRTGDRGRDIAGTRLLA